MAHSDTLVVRDICLWESARSENLTLFSIITGCIVLGMIRIMFSDVICIQQRPTAECDQHKCATLPLQQLVKSALPRQKADQEWTKVMADHKTLLKGYQTSSKHCQGPYFDFDIGFRELWAKTVELVGRFHTIVEQCTMWCSHQGKGPFY